jgi:ABC-type molybdate transport system permease subunit
MTINSTLFGQFILLLMIIVGVLAWRLARRKSRHPVLITFLCVLPCLAPPFAILALLILALKQDLPARA